MRRRLAVPSRALRGCCPCRSELEQGGVTGTRNDAAVRAAGVYTLPVAIVSASCGVEPGRVVEYKPLLHVERSAGGRRRPRPLSWPPSRPMRRGIIPRLVHVALRTPPMPERLLELRLARVVIRKRFAQSYMLTPGSGAAPPTLTGREPEQAMRIRKPSGRRRSTHELQHDQQHVPTAHGQWAELPGAVVPARLFLGRRRVGRSVAGRRRAVRGGSGAGPLHGLPRTPVGGQQGVRRHRRAAAHDDAEPVDAGGDLAFDGSGGAGRPRGSAAPARPAVARELHRLPGPGEPWCCAPSSR